MASRWEKKQKHAKDSKGRTKTEAGTSALGKRFTEEVTFEMGLELVFQDEKEGLGCVGVQRAFP